MMTIRVTDPKKAEGLYYRLMQCGAMPPGNLPQNPSDWDKWFVQILEVLTPLETSDGHIIKVQRTPDEVKYYPMNVCTMDLYPEPHPFDLEVTPEPDTPMEAPELYDPLNEWHVALRQRMGLKPAEPPETLTHQMLLDVLKAKHRAEELEDEERKTATEKRLAEEIEKVKAWQAKQSEREKDDNQEVKHLIQRSIDGQVLNDRPKLPEGVTLEDLSDNAKGIVDYVWEHKEPGRNEFRYENRVFLTGLRPDHTDAIDGEAYDYIQIVLERYQREAA